MIHKEGLSYCTWKSQWNNPTSGRCDVTSGGTQSLSNINMTGRSWKSNMSTHGSHWDIN